MIAQSAFLCSFFPTADSFNKVFLVDVFPSPSFELWTRLAAASCGSGGADAGLVFAGGGFESLASFRRGPPPDVNTRSCCDPWPSLVHCVRPAKLGRAIRAAGRQHGERGALSSMTTDQEFFD